MENRRKLQRMKIKRPVYIINLPEGPNGESIDLNPTGISIKSKQDLSEKMLFDGSVKVYKYYVKRTSDWPNGWSIHYISVFLDEKIMNLLDGASRTIIVIL